jgi:hypothetical protein
MANPPSAESESNQQQGSVKSRLDPTVKAAVISAIIVGVAAIIAAIITASTHSPEIKRLRKSSNLMIGSLLMSPSARHRCRKRGWWS